MGTVGDAGGRVDRARVGVRAAAPARGVKLACLTAAAGGPRPRRRGGGGTVDRFEPLGRARPHLAEAQICAEAAMLKGVQRQNLAIKSSIATDGTAIQIA